ncbi:hypothetical protein WDU94_010368, partial [Cyamophila willieti]
QNKEIWTRFDRIISRNESKETLLKEKTKVLIEDTRKFSKSEKLMKILVDFYEPFQIQKSVDNAYKLFILDNPDRQRADRTKSKPKPVSTTTIRLEDKHDYLSQVLRVATGLYESAEDTMRPHVSMETISF